MYKLLDPPQTFWIRPLEREVLTSCSGALQKILKHQALDFHLHMLLPVAGTRALPEDLLRSAQSTAMLRPLTTGGARHAG
jgi:hypothetical protein